MKYEHINGDFSALRVEMTRKKLLMTVMTFTDLAEHPTTHLLLRKKNIMLAIKMSIY